MRRNSLVAFASGSLAIALGVLALAPSDASAASAAPVVSSACPSRDIEPFVAAFAEDPALQKAFTAATVDTAFIDYDAQPEPAESVEALPRAQLRFPVMPNRARQTEQGLQTRHISTSASRAVVALEVPDTDLQLTYTFRLDGCWTLVKIVDPAFGKAFPGHMQPDPDASPSRSATADGHQAPRGLSATFAACMQRAGSQRIPGAACLTAERDRQDARLNKVYRELIGNLQGDRRDRMIEAQRAWVKLQQKDGAFEASILDQLGAMGDLQAVEYEARAICERADRLERYSELGKL